MELIVINVVTFLVILIENVFDLDIQKISFANINEWKVYFQLLKTF